MKLSFGGRYLIALIVSIMGFYSSACAAEVAPGLHQYSLEAGTYSLYVPTTSSGIMIVALHGSGETSSGYIQNWLASAAQSGLIILAPQSLDRNGWQGQDLEVILKLSAYYKQTMAVKKVIISGASSGGHIALLLGVDYPDLYAGTVTFMGTISPRMLPYFKFDDVRQRHPFYMVHGEKDTMIPIEYGRQSADFLRQKGYKVVFKRYPEMKHEHYRIANRAIIDWIEKLP